MTAETIIEDVIEREGGFVVNPDDKGGPTKYGITAETLGRWRNLNRAATREEVYNLTPREAGNIYYTLFIGEPQFTEENIPYTPLRVQVIDFGVNSGPARALRWLQRILRVPATGMMDSPTRHALSVIHTTPLFEKESSLVLVNDALVAARLYMIDSFTDADSSQKQFEEGIESRAASFFLARP